LPLRRRHHPASHQQAENAVRQFVAFILAFIAIIIMMLCNNRFLMQVNNPPVSILNMS